MYQTQLNYQFYNGAVVDDDDMTIPGQSVTVQQIVFNAVNGLPSNVQSFEDSEIDPYEDYFDVYDEAIKANEKIDDEDDPVKDKDEDVVKKDEP